MDLRSPSVEALFSGEIGSTEDAIHAKTPLTDLGSCDSGESSPVPSKTFYFRRTGRDGDEIFRRRTFEIVFYGC